MNDIKAQLEKLLTEASECALIASLAISDVNATVRSRRALRRAGLRSQKSDSGNDRPQVLKSAGAALTPV